MKWNINSLKCKAIAGKSPSPFPACDWRFNEFANPAAHALYATWVELMALPVKGPEVGNKLFDVIFKGSFVTDNANIRTNILEWINAVGLVLSSLPVNLYFLISTSCFMLLSWSGRLIELINCYKTLKKHSQRGFVRLIATYFKSFYLHQLNSKSNGPVLLLRQYLGIETVFCRLLKQMVKINIDLREKWKSWANVFKF